jgi:hypothetical protein
MGNSTYYHWLASGRRFRMTRHDYGWHTARKAWSCSSCDSRAEDEAYNALDVRSQAAITHKEMVEIQKAYDDLNAQKCRESIQKGDSYYRDGDRILCTKCAEEEGVPPR